MKTLKTKTKRVTGFGTVQGYDTVAMMRFDKQLSQMENVSLLEKFNIVRLYYCIQMSYLTENFRYNRKHYSALADHLGYQHNTRKMIDLVVRCGLFEVSEEKDKYGMPLWFYSPLMHRPTPNLKF